MPRPKVSGVDPWSAPGNTLAPKKRGAGRYGWGTWQDDVKYMDEELVTDEKEAPTYFVSSTPSEATQAHFVSSAADLGTYKKAVKSALREFTANPDFAAFEAVVRDLDMTLYHQDLLKIIVQYGLDQTDVNRALLADLLTHLFQADLLTSLQCTAGFRKIFNNLDDILVDVPNARSLIQEFTDSAISQHLVASTDIMAMEEEVQFLADHEAVASIKTKISSLVRDFLSHNEIEDCVTSIRELNASHMGFEVVKQFVLTAFDRDMKARELVSRLLSEATCAASVISHEQVAKGFTVLLQRTEDIFLDVPNVLGYLSFFIARAISDEVLPPSFVLRVDLLPQDMGFQVVEQARYLLNQRGASELLADVWTEKVPDTAAPVTTPSE